MLSDLFTILTNGRSRSTWSERHVAFAAGLGTINLHEALITEVGCNVRLASVVTDAPLELTKRKSDDPYANCLFYSKGICRECEDKCPAGAITQKGYDKILCYNYVQKIARKMISCLQPFLKLYIRRVNGVLSSPTFPVGCAFCQFGVPCMDKNPIENGK
jgi:epoxyqueuosine reductase